MAPWWVALRRKRGVSPTSSRTPFKERNYELDCCYFIRVPSDSLYAINLAGVDPVAQKRGRDGPGLRRRGNRRSVRRWERDRPDKNAQIQHPHVPRPDRS